VDQNVVHVTTGGNTYQGVYFENEASITRDAKGNVKEDRNQLAVQGDTKSGLGGFSFTFTGNCSNTCLASAFFTFQGSAQQAAAALSAAGFAPYPFTDLMFDSLIEHPGALQFRNRLGWNPSPHFSVPVNALDLLSPAPTSGGGLFRFAKLRFSRLNCAEKP